MTHSSIVAIVLVAGSFGAAASAQTSPARFEVASVKRSTSNEPGSRINTQPGRVVAENVTLRMLILNAYAVRDTQLDVRAAPDWIGTDRFDIEATMAATATREQIAQMMQSLLADRFKLVARRDLQTRTVYSLAPVRTDGSLGAGIRRVSEPCVTPSPAGCGTVTFSPGRLSGRAVSWAQIVTALSGVPAVDRLVVDGGGPQGTFDFELKWTPAGRAGGAGSADAPDSIFTALQEQLGVKLTPLDAPVPVVIVTDATRPDAN